MIVNPVAVTNSLVFREVHSVVLELFGHFRLILSGEVAPLACGSKGETLLVQLALSRGSRTRRERLIDQLWPSGDPPLAKQSFNTLTSQVNRLCRPHLDGADLITHENGTYRLSQRPDVIVDIDQFDRWRKDGLGLLSNGNPGLGAELCGRAIALYRGDLAGDSSLEAVMERERLRLALTDVLYAMAGRRFSEGDLSGCNEYAQSLLRVDPCREDAHRLVMRSLVSLGLRSQALRQYRLCREILFEMYDAEPERATSDLFDEIRLNLDVSTGVPDAFDAANRNRLTRQTA